MIVAKRIAIALSCIAPQTDSTAEPQPTDRVARWGDESRGDSSSRFSNRYTFDSERYTLYTVS